MATVKVRNLKNKEVGDVELSDAIFGVELNESLIHAAVRNYLANRRQGTSATKTRGNVSGSGRKLWKQKGTGRARIASLRSPLWKGGGNVHGPQPRDWSYKMPKKMRRGALRSALSERLREGNLIIIEDFSFENPKTKGFLGVMSDLGFGDKRKATKTLIVDSLDNSNLVLASRNVQKTKVTNGYGLNVYDIIYHEKLLISKSAIEEINHLLDPQREKGEASEDAPTEEKPKARSATKPKPKTVKTKSAKPKAKKTDRAKAATKPKAKKTAKAKTAAKPAAKKTAKAKTTKSAKAAPKKAAKPKKGAAK